MGYAGKKVSKQWKYSLYAVCHAHDPSHGTRRCMSKATCTVIIMFSVEYSACTCSCLSSGISKPRVKGRQGGALSNIFWLFRSLCASALWASALVQKLGGPAPLSDPGSPWTWTLPCIHHCTGLLCWDQSIFRIIIILCGPLETLILTYQLTVKLRKVLWVLRIISGMFIVVQPQQETTNHKSDQYYRSQFSHVVSDWICFAT